MKQALIALVVLPLVLADAAPAVDTLSDSVVLFTSRKSGSPMVHGGGIVVGSDDHAVYIATVGHIATIDDLRVQFYAARGKEYIAYVFPESDNAELDFAIISVEMPANDPVRRSLRPLAYRTDKIPVNASVRHIGHAESVWDSITGNKVLREQPNHVYFSNTGIAAASSGGPIFDDESRLLGLVTQVNSTSARALKVEVILYYLREWKVPMNLIGTTVASRVAPNSSAMPKWAASEKFLVFDRFGDNRNRWPISSDAEIAAQVAEGAYQVGSKVGKINLSTIPVAIDQERDFDIRVSGRMLRGTDPFYFGVLWGYRDTKNFFRFTIADNGKGVVASESNGITNVYVNIPPEKSNAQMDKTNRLVIQKRGTQLRFGINGRLIHEMEFVAFFGNRIGFIAARDVLLSFDDFEVVQAPAN